MKNIFLLFFLILCTAVESQIVLEHTYPYGNIERVNLPLVGERYYATTYDNFTKKGKIYWFDANHQPVGTQNFEGPATNSAVLSVDINRVTSDLFDTDPGIEYEKDWVSGSFGSGISVGRSMYDDNGVELFPPFTSYAHHFVTTGGNKIVSEGKVYGMPGFIPEYSFPAEAAFGYFSLENGQEKFWYYHNAHLVLLNQDYSVYSDIPVNLDACAANSTYFSIQGQHDINDDDKIETFNSRWCGGIFQVQYYSDSDLIFDLEALGVQYSIAKSILPSAHPGIDAAECWIFYGFMLRDSIVVYDVLSGVPEHKFLGDWTYLNSDSSGLKYVKNRLDKTETVVRVLNPDYSVWADFEKDTSAPMEVLALGEKIFDEDPNSLELFSRRTLSSSYRWQISRPDGSIIFELETPFRTEVVLDQKPGLKKKLIFNHTDPVGAESRVTYVYGLPDPPPFAPGGHEETFRLQPNPFSDILLLDFSGLSASVDNIYIYDMQGHQVYEQNVATTDPSWEIPGAGNWPAGLYLIQVYSGGASLMQKAIRH